MLLTVLDYQMRGITIERAMQHYRQHARQKVSNFEELKALLAQYPNTKEGNLLVAQYLWGYKYWTRVELLRRFVDYFESVEVTSQEKLKQWATTVDFEKDFKGKIKGAGLAIFQWLVMRQGIETIKPDVWIHRFIQKTLGYKVNDKTAVKVLEQVAKTMNIKAYELDWRIWEHERRQP